MGGGGFRPPPLKTRKIKWYFNETYQASLSTQEETIDVINMTMTSLFLPTSAFLRRQVRHFWVFDHVSLKIMPKVKEKRFFSSVFTKSKKKQCTLTYLPGFWKSFQELPFFCAPSWPKFSKIEKKVA